MSDGVLTDKVLKVGIIGQGRSGRNIHGSLLAKIPQHYKIAAIADSIPERQQLAKEEYQCHTYSSWEDMVAAEELDLVVNASPSHLHFEISLALLKKGVNVLCEKPLAKTSAEVDELIAAAKSAGSILAVFQQSRYQPAYEKMRQVIDSGVLGKILQIDFTDSEFLRRWDWQTLISNNGGNLMNKGPHPLDQALQLFGNDINPNVLCKMARANTFGDAEDYVKIILSGEDRPVIDLEVSSSDVYPNNKFRVLGTNGGLRGTTKHLEWKYFKPEEAPQQQLVPEPMADADGKPIYCKETLTWYEESWDLELEEGYSEFQHMTKKLYLMLHNTITAGAPLEITPEQVRQQLWVMEECRRQNQHIYG